jgi:hypothetical protein
MLAIFILQFWNADFSTKCLHPQTDISDISKLCLLCLGSLIFLLPKTFKLLSFGFQSFDEGYSINLPCTLNWISTIYFMSAVLSWKLVRWLSCLFQWYTWSITSRKWLYHCVRKYSMQVRWFPSTSLLQKRSLNVQFK